VREYEFTFIVQPEISEEGLQAVCDKYDSVLEKHGSIRLYFDDWGRRRLAYEIQKFQKGHYLLLHFLDDGKVVPELERVSRIDDSILRFLTVLVSERVEDIEARKSEAATLEEDRKRKAAERAVREAEEAAERATREAQEAAERATREAKAAAESAAREAEEAEASTDQPEEAEAAEEESGAVEEAPEAVEETPKAVEETPKAVEETPEADGGAEVAEVAEDDEEKTA